MGDIAETEENFEKQLGFVRCGLTPNGLSGITTITYEIKSSKVSNPEWKSNQIIATDLDTEVKYSASELVNKRILVSYKEDGAEVYFWGQYNSKHHWDGYCTINVYKNDELILVTDAEYGDGELIKYQQALPDVNASGEDIWIISDRVCDGAVNKGVSIRYWRKDSLRKDFNLKSVDIEDIIDVRELRISLGNDIEAYYSGNTSDGRYNDETGDAYFVSYFKDGSVKTLYKGKFVDGKFKDPSEDSSWYIVREKDTDYMYYKGPFDNNTAVYDDDKYYVFNLNRKDIKKYVEGYEFACTLKWNFGEVNK